MRSSGFTSGKQPQASLRLEGAPTHAHLVQLLNASQKELDKQVWISWPGDAGDCRYALSVINFGPQQRKNWALELKSSVGEPEWHFYKELDNEPKDLWTVRTGDLELILGLITSEPVAQAPTQRPGDLNAKSGAPLDGDGRKGDRDQDRPNQWSTGPLTPLPPKQDNHRSERAHEMASALLLSGNLKEVDLPSIMQSINLCKMTGKLNLGQGSIQAEVFFNEGEMIHAEAGDTILSQETVKGDDVILDLFTWDEGTFQFQHGWKTTGRTIKRKMHSLLLEGATLHDYQESLAKAEFTTGSILCREQTKAQISESQFDDLIKRGLDLHADVQKKIFLILREPAPLNQILESMPVPRSVWVPAVFNLINQGLLTVSGGIVDDKEDATMFLGVEKQIEGAQRSLLQPDSGMFSYNYFMLKTSQEFARMKNGGQPFCLVMLEFSSPHLLTNEALSVISGCYDKLKRPFDVFAFCLPSFFFVLLPQTNTRMAKDIIQRFLQDLATAKLDLLTEGSALATRGGITNVPRDGIELIEILKRASRFRRLATADNPIVTADKQQG